MIFHFFKINTDAFDVDMRPERKEKYQQVQNFNDSFL